MPEILWEGHRLMVHVNQKPNDGLELNIHSPNIPEGDTDPYLFVAEVGYEHCPSMAGLTICFPMYSPVKISRLQKVLPIIREVAKIDPDVAEWLRAAQRGWSGYE